MARKEDTKYEKVQVECHSGYRANEYPVSFTFQGQCWNVAEIVDRWYEGDKNPERPMIDYFRVKTTEGRVFMLMYTRQDDEWIIRYQT